MSLAGPSHRYEKLKPVKLAGEYAQTIILGVLFGIFWVVSEISAKLGVYARRDVITVLLLWFWRPEMQRLRCPRAGKAFLYSKAADCWPLNQGATCCPQLWYETSCAVHLYTTQVVPFRWAYSNRNQLRMSRLCRILSGDRCDVCTLYEHLWDGSRPSRAMQSMFWGQRSRIVISMRMCVYIKYVCIH